MATREALIDAAERVFRREGVTRTSLAEIAHEAGVTRGAIYWHFRDKAQLLDAMCSRTMLPLDAALARASESGLADPLSAVRGFAIDALMQLATCQRTQAVFEVLFHKCELVDDLEARGAAQKSDRRKCLSGVEKLFDLAVQHQQLARDTDVRLATHMLHAYVLGVMREWVAEPASYDLGASAAAMIDAFIAGLRAHPPRKAAADSPA
ncbi:MAG TPA: TetR family transcriptional regulator [Casimicrobiaceae bacterium]|nr:TetR family transcriptional regulator [Casimicrobiaceae bacterium]